MKIEFALSIIEQLCDNGTPMEVQALKTIYAYINESQKTSANSQSMPCSHEFLSGPFMTGCIKCKATFPNRQSH